MMTLMRNVSVGCWSSSQIHIPIHLIHILNQTQQPSILYAKIIGTNSSSNNFLFVLLLIKWSRRNDNVYVHIFGCLLYGSSEFKCVIIRMNNKKVTNLFRKKCWNFIRTFHYLIQLFWSETRRKMRNINIKLLAFVLMLWIILSIVRHYLKKQCAQCVWRKFQIVNFEPCKWSMFFSFSILSCADDN